MPELGSVRVVATSNVAAVTAGGTPLIDDVQTAVGDEILLAGQTNGAKNGVLVVSATAWARRADTDTAAEFVPGMHLYVRDGSEWGGSRWHYTGTATPTLESTIINFDCFARVEHEKAGAGMEDNSGGTVGAIGLPVITSAIEHRLPAMSLNKDWYGRILNLEYEEDAYGFIKGGIVTNRLGDGAPSVDCSMVAAYNLGADAIVDDSGGVVTVWSSGESCP